jgi:hypothetical protein
MNFLQYDLHCFKPSPVGGIGYDLVLSKSEIAMLQLLLSRDGEALQHWKMFWSEVSDYEIAPFGCKELMPLAVRKMQKAVTQSEWQSVVPSHASFLSGLPKYAWSKNKVILLECYKLADQLHQRGVEIMAIKGIAEMIRIPDIMLMRTSRDIDLLIQPKDLEVSIELFQSLGWHSDQVVNGVPSLLSEFEGNSFTFDHPNYPVSLDIHFDVVSDGRGQYGDFTSELWLNKLRAPCSHPIFIPSPENRFCLFLANAFVPDNWTSGLVNKYLYDLLFQLQDMSDDDRVLATIKAEKYLNLGDAVEQIILLYKQVANPKLSKNKLALAQLNLKNRLKMGIRVCEEPYYYFWHLHNHYQPLLPVIRKKNGPFLCWTYLFFSFIFNTRPVQVVYWRLITLKDQLIERTQYYLSRVVFHIRKHISSASNSVKGLSTPQKNQNLHNQPMASVDQSSNDNSTKINTQNNATIQSPEIAEGNLLPAGMTRNFYLSAKLFKF